jgi:uncharacterized protein
MLLQLADIPAAGLELDYEHGARELDVSDEQTVLDSPIHVRVRVLRVGETVSVSGTLDCRMRLQCSRCLEWFGLPLDVRLATDFNPAAIEPQPSPGQEKELAPDELERYFYRDEEVLLDEYIREQVLLALPMVPVCRPDCAGLCPHCGINRNTSRCDCPAAPEELSALGRQLLKLRKSQR